MVPLEKILSDILNKMEDDDMKIVENQTSSNNNIEDTNIKKTNNKYEKFSLKNENINQKKTYINNQHNLKEQDITLINNNNNAFFNNLNTNTNKQTSALDMIIKDAILQWLDSVNGQKIIKECFLEVTNEKLNLPINFINNTLGEKLSDKEIYKMFQRTLKNSLNI